MCKWLSKINPNYRCSVPAIPGSDYCIFHSEGPKCIREFREAITKQISSSDSLDAGNAPFDFTGYWFPSGVSVAPGAQDRICAVLPRNIPGNLSLLQARIDGDLLLNGLRVIGCIDARESLIEGEVQIVDGEVSAGLFLDDAQFRSVVQVMDTSVRAPSSAVAGPPGSAAISARSARFEHDLIIMSCDVDGSVALARASSDGNLQLDHSKICGGLYLRGVSWNGFVSLNNASLEAAFDASHATIRHGISIGNATIESLDLTGTSIHGTLNAQAATIRSFLLLSACSSRGLLLGADRPTISPVKNRAGLTIRHRETEADFWQFAQLVLEQEGKRSKADAAHYLGRIARLRAAIASASHWQKPGHILAYLLDLLFLRWPIAYGASLLRLVATWLTIVGGFALTYFALVSSGVAVFSPTSTGMAFPFSVGRAIYFSIITFTTLGYGDLQPAPGIGTLLCSIEAILGGVIMALTVLVIGRKFMR